MKYICLISEGRENHSYIFSAADQTIAEEQAKRYFDRFTSDTGRDYYDEDSLPDIELFEITKPIVVNIVSHWKEKQEQAKKDSEKFQEKHDRAVYERLKEKFEK
jgi:hypothetical protein